MKKQFVVFYFMKKEPEKIQKVVPSHVEYWKKRNLRSIEEALFLIDQGD